MLPCELFYQMHETFLVLIWFGMYLFMFYFEKFCFDFISFHTKNAKKNVRKGQW